MLQSDEALHQAFRSAVIGNRALSRRSVIRGGVISVGFALAGIRGREPDATELIDASVSQAAACQPCGALHGGRDA